MVRVIIYSAIFALQFFLNASAATDKVVCYHGTWSTYNTGNNKFTIEDIDPKICTHIIYSFVGIHPNGTIRLLDPNLDIANKGFERFNALKKKNPQLKTLLAIGGWNEGSTNYSIVVGSAELRKRLVKDAVGYLTKYGFDGFDFDWEYPCQRGGKPEDKANFVTLLKELKEEFTKHKLILTAAVAAAVPSIDISYDIPSISKYLDFIHIMAYDLHGVWDERTGINGPLYPSPVDITPAQKELNVDACIKAWIKRGAPPEKIILGMGTYGQTFTLANISNTEIGAPIKGGGNVPGSYRSICEMQKQGGWTIKWSNEQKAPYTYKGDQWIGYDNVESFTMKTEYAKNLTLGGLMIWSIESDDFKGICGPKFPLLSAINKALGRN